MRFLVYTVTVCLALSSAPAWASDKDSPKVDCGSYGTSVEFLESPSEAARQALKDQKLVFVLHVSGHFEDPGVT